MMFSRFQNPVMKQVNNLASSYLRNPSSLNKSFSSINSIAMFANRKISNNLESGSFRITNFPSIVSQYHLWRQELPMVEPFYAVKCNPDPNILRLLALLGCNFDCATKGEMDLILNGLDDGLDFAPRNKAKDSIVYANPAHMPHMLQYAKDNNVRMTTFDSEDELYKIASIGGKTGFDLLLRIATDDKASICPFSNKFGCPIHEVTHLLDTAQLLGLNVIGVSFHVGSNCGDASAYKQALEDTKLIFNTAINMGMTPMRVVDIGGGFPCTPKIGQPSFQALARTIRECIEKFPKSIYNPVRFIGEPGRFMVESSTTIVTKIYSRKGGNGDTQDLYIDDGVYGSFNNVVYDHAEPIPEKLSTIVSKQIGGILPDDALDIPTSIFGPTCDGLDQICKKTTTKIPRCKVGEWLLWQNMGAYTHTASFNFNGYTHIPNHLYLSSVPNATDSIQWDSSHI